MGRSSAFSVCFIVHGQFAVLNRLMHIISSRDRGVNASTMYCVRACLCKCLLGCVRGVFQVTPGL